MRYKAKSKLTLKQEKLEELNLESYKKLLSKLKEYELFLGDFGAYLNGHTEFIFKRLEYMPSDEKNILESKRIRELVDIYDEFKNEFKEKTNITINLEYHDTWSYGDEINDEVQGCYFSLEMSDLYELTESAKKLGTDSFNWSYFVESDN